MLAITALTIGVNRLEAAVLPTQNVIRQVLEREFGVGDIMVQIAWCESNWRQYDSFGKVLRNPSTPDHGVFQINEKYWLEQSLVLGHSIFTLEGNIEMAKHILEVQGLEAWKPSKECWRPYLKT